MKAKKTKLPKDIETLFESLDLEELKILFDTYDVNARGDYSKQTALAFDQCPDELARWLVRHGADLAAPDNYGNTPLHSRARSWKGRIKVLLELGADVNQGENMRGTPLHSAAESYNAPSARLLLQHGAHVDAVDHEGRTPLAHALRSCSNSRISDMAMLAEVLLEAGAQRTSEMKAFVARIGTDFEFHRSGFNPDFLEATSSALDKLYVLFDAPPVPRRIQHDGKSPIVARSARRQDQHKELWDLLVPSSGAASTVQGEVVRIAGRIHDEIQRNGGGNWDLAYRKMAEAFLVHIGSGAPLDKSLLDEASQIVAELESTNVDTSRLCELAVAWVALNPAPQKLPPPNYRR
jgi:hypothetical protein